MWFTVSDDRGKGDARARWTWRRRDVAAAER